MDDEHRSALDEAEQDRENLVKKHDALLAAHANLREQWAKKRHAAGRFTLEEAAVIIVAKAAAPCEGEAIELHRERDWPRLSRLVQSARTGELPVYSDDGLKWPLDNASTAKWFGREAYWEDLNIWLAKNEPHVGFQFSPPSEIELAGQLRTQVTGTEERALDPRFQVSGEQEAAERHSDDWKSVARGLAQKIAESKWNSKIREITVRNIAEAVARELATTNNKQYWGNRGPRTASNIRNEALAGWKFTPPETLA